MKKVCHFEIPVDDMARAKKFYAIFGWHMEEFPGMDYVGVRTTSVDEQQRPKEVGSINGGIMKRSKEAPAPVFAIEVPSIDEYVKKAVAAGGKVVKPKWQIGEMGYYAYVKDTEGNVLGLWESSI